jgi:hypothetical protein
MIQIDFKPTLSQSLVWDAFEDEDSTSILTGGGVNSGKSYNLMAMATIKALMYPETRYLVGRKNLSNLMKTTANTLWKVFREFGLVADVHYEYNGSSRVVSFYNGSEILFDHLTYEPSDPDVARLGGLELTAAFLDEVADCDYRVIEVVHERVGRHNNEKYNIKPLVFMTCNPSRGWLKSKYYTPFTKNKLPEFKRVILSTARSNPHASAAYIKNLINILSPQELERQLNGSWDFGDNPDQLTTYEKAEAAYFHVFDEDSLKGETWYLTADIAFASDRCIVGVWCGWRLLKIVEVDVKNGEKPEDVIRALQIEYKISGKNVAYDSTGAGLYLKNYISGAYAFHAGGKPLKDTKQKTFEHLKTQMYCHLADKINDGSLEIFTDAYKDDLLDELTMIRSIPREKIDSVMKLISKNEIKKLIGRSCDLLDMMSIRGVFDYKTQYKRNF